MQQIGFIGLGNMGHLMAERLLMAGFTLRVFDKIPEKAQTLGKLGAFVDSNVIDLIENVEIIITSLQSSEQVKSLCTDENGIFNRIKSNGLFIDCSSIDIDTTIQLHHLAAAKNIAMLDAPVSGGVAGAAKGTLTFMVGGSASNLERAIPILTPMSKKIVHAGPGGQGQGAKICNNLLLGISMIGVSEAFSLAKKIGLDQKKFFDISSNASGQCWSMTSYCPVPYIIENVPANNHYEPGFMAKMMLKDLKLSRHAAESVDAAIPLGALTIELYELFVNQGFGEKDFSAIINFIANNHSPA